MALRDKLKFWLALNNYIEMIVRDTSLLSLSNAMEDSLDYLKALGGTEITPKVYFDSVTANGGCEQRNLPSEYTQVEYIWMDGHSYLLTDIIPAYDGHYELDMQTLSLIASPQTYFGARDDSSGTNGLRFAHITNKTCRVYGLSDTYITSSDSMTNDTRYKFVYGNKSVTVSEGNTIFLTGTFESDQVITTPLAINGWNTNGTIAVNAEGMYVYSFKAFNAQGELVADYVPAIQKGTSLVVGFYDTVSKTFKTATAGTFTAGPNAVPTPDNPMDIYCNNGVLKANLNLYWTEYNGYQLSQTDGITVTTNSGVNVSGMIDCKTIKSFKITTISPQGAFRIFKYGADNTFINAAATANVGDIITFEDNVGFFRIQYNYTSIGVNTENILIYNNAYNLNKIYADGTVEKINICGKNLFDGQWQAGIYNTSTGAHSSAPNRICNINMIQVKPSTTYTVSCPDYTLAGGMRWLFYDVNKNFISAITSGAATTITTPTNTRYINFYIANNLTVDIAPDLQIEQSSTATTYEPYFDGGSATTEMLLSVGDYKDTQEVLSGNVTRNIGIKVLDGTEDWSMGSALPTFALVIQESQGNLTAALCTNFKGYSGAWTNMPNNSVMSHGTRLGFRCDSITSLEAWKQWLATQYANGTPVIIVYPLATPTTESVSSQPLTYIDNYTLTIEDASISNPIVNATNSTHTIPTPDKPLDITCNNGVLKLTTGFDINRLYKTGNPSVSNEGIYTTNSSQSYVRTQNDVNFSTANSWSFKWKFTYKGANTDQGIMSGEGKPNVQAIINSAGRPRFSIGDNTDWQVIWNDSSITFAYQEGVEYENEIYFNGTRYGYKVNGIEIGGVDSTARAANTYFAVGVERQRTSTQYTRCAWDLSKTSLIVDGVEQFPWIVGAITTDGTVETINVHGKNLLNDTNIVNAYNATGNYTHKGYFVTSISSYTNNPLYRVAHCVLPAGSYRFETDTANAYMLRYAIGSAVTELFSDNQKQYIDFTLTTTTEFSICWRNATSTEFTGEHSWISKGSTATSYEPYFNGGAATAEMLLKVGNYQDVQSIISGAVTRNIGVKVLDGTEAWVLDGVLFYTDIASLGINHTLGVTSICTHYKSVNNQISLTDVNYNAMRVGYYNSAYLAYNYLYIKDLNITTVAQLKQFLADQYAAGTPVIVVYPLATPTTESVSGQALQVTEGNNIAEITQAGLDNLELEAKYNSVP